MNKHIIPILVILLFIVSAVSPMVIGFESDAITDVNSEMEELLDDLAFYCYDANGSNAKYEYYKEQMLKDYPNGEIEIVEEVIQPVEPISATSSGGPMDSAWPMYCHDERHTGRSPYSTANTDGIEKWRFDTIHECSGSPIIDKEGIIYIGASTMLAVYPNGTLKWQFEMYGMIVSAPAIDENGILYFGTIYGDKLYALYSNNGTVKWKHKIGPTWASPTVGDDGIIYAPATDNWNVFAFYPNGTVKWKYKVGSHIRTSPCIADDGTIYTVSTDGPLFAFNPVGTVKWNTTVGGGTSPTIGQDGTIYCGYKDLYAVNPVNGSIKWICDLGGSRTIKDGTPCNSVDGTIYLGTYIGERDGGELIAVNPDGTEKWRKMIASNWVMSAPAIGEDGTVYVGSWNDGYNLWAWGYLHAFGPVESNSPPETPTISGQINGKIGDCYPYELLANDPDNNPVSFYIEWGDGINTGWTIDVASREKCTIYHTWNKQGNFTIKVKARDTFGEESDWAYLEVTMPKNQQVSNMWFLRLLESHPRMFPILRHLFRLE